MKEATEENTELTDDLNKKISISIFFDNNRYSAQLDLDRSKRIIFTNKNLDFTITLWTINT